MPQKIITQTNNKHHDGGERDGDFDGDKREVGYDFGHVGGEYIGGAFFQVVKDQPSLSDAHDNGGEVVCQELNLGGLLGNGGSAAHGNAHMSSLERGRVVDPVLS